MTDLDYLNIPKEDIADSFEELDTRWLMSTEQGRRVAWTILAMAGIFRSSYDPVPSNMAFREGQRNVGNLFLSKITEYAHEDFLTMLREGNEIDRKK